MKEEEVVEQKPRQINSPIEATEALLKQFRPIRESVSELKRLLLQAQPGCAVSEMSRTFWYEDEQSHTV